MQRSRHVDAGPIVVEAFEPDIARPRVSTDALQKRMERHARPLADRAPALDADVPGDLAFLREHPQFGERPGLLVRNKARKLEPPRGGIDGANLALRVIGVEWKRPRDRACRVASREP